MDWAKSLDYGAVVETFVSVMGSNGLSVSVEPLYESIVVDGAIRDGPMNYCSWEAKVGKRTLFLLLVDSKKNVLRLPGQQLDIRKHYGLSKAEVFEAFPKTKGWMAPTLSLDEAMLTIEGYAEFLERMQKRSDA